MASGTFQSKANKSGPGISPETLPCRDQFKQKERNEDLKCHGLHASKFGFAFCCFSCQIPKMDNDFCCYSMRLLCVGSDLCTFRENNDDRVLGGLANGSKQQEVEAVSLNMCFVCFRLPEPR